MKSPEIISNCLRSLDEKIGTRLIYWLCNDGKYNKKKSEIVDGDNNNGNPNNIIEVNFELKTRRNL